MEEADQGWLMIRIGEWVNVSSGTGPTQVVQTLLLHPFNGLFSGQPG